MALGTNLSAIWITVANGWMQNPTGAVFNTETMRMEVVDFMAVVFNPVAQAKFVHTVSAGYVTGAVFVMAISALFLLRNKHKDLARRSFAVAAAFGLLSSLSVVVLGDEWLRRQRTPEDEAGRDRSDVGDRACAGRLHRLRHPEPGHPPERLRGEDPLPDGPDRHPFVEPADSGHPELVERAEHRVRGGQLAYGALERLRANKNDVEAREMFDRHWQDLGHGLLLKRYRDDILNATPQEISQAAMDTVPRVMPLFWTFRVMAGLGFYLIAFFALAFYYSCRNNFRDKRWFLKLAVWTLPAPWIAIECGWFVAEYGRQPWAVDGVLPTFYAASGLALHEIVLTLAGFTAIYTALIVVEIKLMLKAIRKGPDELLPSLQSPQPHASHNASAPVAGQA